jgi:hypothetical protein
MKVIDGEAELLLAPRIRGKIVAGMPPEALSSHTNRLSGRERRGKGPCR